MTDSQGITLYTSIPPVMRRMAGGAEYGEAYQKECIDSWITGGFRVVSINPRSEIEKLAHKYPQVRFIDSGSEDFRTKISVFLQTIAASGEPIAGIINADCYLLNCYSIAARIRTGSQDSIVLLRRLDIDSKAMRPTRGKYLGFDGFLFDTRFLPRIEDPGDWNIGTPCWDYWFPIEMYLAGARIRKLDVPVLLHLGHEGRWDFAENDTRAALLWDTLNAHSRRTLNGEKLASSRVLCGADLSDETRKVEQIADGIIPWLNHQAETIHLSNEGAAGDFVSRVLLGLEGSEEATLRHQLETVTFFRWLQSKRRAARRLGNRIRRQLLSFNLQGPRVDSRCAGKE